MVFPVWGEVEPRWGKILNSIKKRLWRLYLKGRMLFSKHWMVLENLIPLKMENVHFLNGK